MDRVVDALQTSALMAWQIAWSLILGFTLSAVVQAVVRREAISSALGDGRPSTLLRASGLGVAASSCSYAAVALARGLFRKGAAFVAAMVFQIASTNLVIELGIILALLLGWRFTLAEFIGGAVMIVCVALAFGLIVSDRLVDAARHQADKGFAGSMEGHAAMDMSLEGTGSAWSRLTTRRGVTAVSHIFVMEWAAVLRDIAIGLLIAGAVAVWVPTSWWQNLFLTDNHTLALLVGPLLGPVIAVLSFVCSIGNVPLAAVLWNGGISFGGVIAFLFADLIILPILVIYRKYYGTRMMLAIAGVFYVSMVVAGYLTEAVFAVTGLTPQAGGARVGDTGISWNYTTWLNILFGLLALALVVLFVRTGGPEMLHHMNGSAEGPTQHGEGAEPPAHVDDNDPPTHRHPE